MGIEPSQSRALPLSCGHDIPLRTWRSRLDMLPCGRHDALVGLFLIHLGLGPHVPSMNPFSTRVSTRWTKALSIPASLYLQPTVRIWGDFPVPFEQIMIAHDLFFMLERIQVPFPV